MYHMIYALYGFLSIQYLYMLIKQEDAAVTPTSASCGSRTGQDAF